LSENIYLPTQPHWANANAFTGAYDLISEAHFNDRGDLSGSKSDLWDKFLTRVLIPVFEHSDVGVC
jgi:hypothetical protein